MEFENEKNLIEYPSPVFIENTKKILRQMEKCVCKICLKDGTKGTGFFCKIPLSKKDFLFTFITNNHVINDNYLNKEKEIKLKMNDGNKTSIKTINIKGRFKYTDEENDVTIIEIKNQDDDNSYEFLDLDENILNDNGDGYIGNSIYILHYPRYFEEDKVAVSYGILKQRFKDKALDFIHFCSTEYGSSGSPVLNLLNNKVIGVHKNRGLKEYNIGIFLHEIIKDFIIKYNNSIVKRVKILSDNEDYELIEIINNLHKKNLISDVNIIKDDKEIKACQLIISKEFKHRSIDNNWIPAWHGRNYENLESIIKHGFKLPGTKLDHDYTIKQNFDIKNKEVGVIKNWENAIFFSQSIFGARIYSNLLENKNKDY